MNGSVTLGIHFPKNYTNQDFSGSILLSAEEKNLHFLLTHYEDTLAYPVRLPEENIRHLLSLVDSTTATRNAVLKYLMPTLRVYIDDFQGVLIPKEELIATGVLTLNAGLELYLKSRQSESIYTFICQHLSESYPKALRERLHPHVNKTEVRDMLLKAYYPWILSNVDAFDNATLRTWEENLTERIRWWDMQARTELVMNHVRIPMSAALKYSGKVSVDGIVELIQVGIEYMYTQTERFDPTKWYFWGYVSPGVNGVLWEYFCCNFSFHQANTLRSLGVLTAHEWRSLPENAKMLTGQESIRDIRKKLDLPEASAQALWRYIHATCEEVTDLIEDPECGQELWSAWENSRMEWRFAEAAIERLTSREQQIMIGRWGLGWEDTKTLKQIGEELDPPLSRESVRIIEERSLSRLHQALNSTLIAPPKYRVANPTTVPSSASKEQRYFEEPRAEYVPIWNRNASIILARVRHAGIEVDSPDFWPRLKKIDNWIENNAITMFERDVYLSVFSGRLFILSARARHFIAQKHECSPRDIFHAIFEKAREIYELYGE